VVSPAVERLACLSLGTSLITPEDRWWVSGRVLPERLVQGVIVRTADGEAVLAGSETTLPSDWGSGVPRQKRSGRPPRRVGQHRALPRTNALRSHPGRGRKPSWPMTTTGAAIAPEE